MNEDRIVQKLDELGAQNTQVLVEVGKIQEKIEKIPDHEVRIRSLERWKYGVPMAGLTAVLSAGISAWTASRGG